MWVWIATLLTSEQKNYFQSRFPQLQYSQHAASNDRPSFFKTLMHNWSGQWAACHDYFMLALQRSCLAAEQQGRERVINNASAPRPPNTGSDVFIALGSIGMKYAGAEGTHENRIFSGLERSWDLCCSIQYHSTTKSRCRVHILYIKYILHNLQFLLSVF